MTDHFAVLDQPRVPWLDPVELRDAYHRKTLEAHPDLTGSRGPDENFVQINEAHHVLQDPKRRLHHLLELEGQAPSSTEQRVPRELHDLFPAIGALTQRTNLLLQKTRTASSALTRALLKPEILELENESKQLREKIQRLSDDSLRHLRQINCRWATDRAGQVGALSDLYFQFAYLARWSAQLDEMMFQLSSL
jgi:curved DNA-binding protein CbpA